jgi:TolA-binding protein
MQKDYPRALDLYNKAIAAADNADADYARYQKSILLGLQNKDAEQETLLQSIIRQSPDSKYKYEAYYSLGELYLEAGKYTQAADQFRAITETNARHLALKALMKTGFALQQADKDEEAIAVYRKVVTAYPGSDQVQPALDALKTLYVSANQPGAYVQLLKENGIAAPDNNGLDSVFYAAAEAQYAAGKFDKAATAMEDYLKQYPGGMFTNKAHFYKAESHEQRKEYAAALKDYDAVLSAPWSDFTEPASRKAAVIAYGQNDFAAAERYYGLLRNNAIGKDQVQIAYRGLMLSAQKQQKEELAAAYADTLLGFTDLAEQTRFEAQLAKGNLALSRKELDQAAALFSQASASGNVETAAEAAYRKATIPLLQQNLPEAEAAATKAIQQTTASEYWNAKSYLLISDIFIAQKDYFNAKATLQSIIRNIKEETLKQEALRKLDEVKKLEKGKSKLSEG